MVGFVQSGLFDSWAGGSYWQFSVVGFCVESPSVRIAALSVWTHWFLVLVFCFCVICGQSILLVDKSRAVR